MTTKTNIPATKLPTKDIAMDLNFVYWPMSKMDYCPLTKLLLNIKLVDPLFRNG